MPITPVLAALIFNEQQEILIARRKHHLRNGGKWEFPGGKLHHRESPENCLQREIKEEMGVKIQVLKPYHLVNYTYPTQQILLIAYTCKLLTSKWRLVDHDAISWSKISGLHRYEFSQADVEIVQKLQGDFL